MVMSRVAFARTVRSEENEGFAGPDMQADPLQDRRPGDFHVQVVYFKHYKAPFSMKNAIPLLPKAPRKRPPRLRPVLPPSRAGCRGRPAAAPGDTISGKAAGAKCRKAYYAGR